MSNPNSNSNIELGSRASNPQPARPGQYPDTELASFLAQNPNYLPQVDTNWLENLQLPVQSYQSSRNSIWEKLWRKKAVNLPILLLFCLHIIDIIPICGGFYYFFQNTGLLLDMQFNMANLLQYMSADLTADPIMDIQIMDERSTCPSGFQILNLGTWPGTLAGCFCEDGTIWNRPCVDINEAKCKKDLPANPPIEMYEWDDSIWCVKKAVLGKDYLRKTECPSGYKECYPGGCFAKDCPITKLEITSTGEATNKFNIKENRYLTVTKSQGELPLINIQMTFGDIPCFTQDLFSQTIKNSAYFLTAIKDKNCDKYGLDTNSSAVLAFQTAFGSFEQNSFPYPVMHLPRFEPDSVATKSVLSSKTRMKAAKYDYCQDINPEFINKYLEAADTLPEVFRFAGYLFFLVPRILCICEILSRRPKTPKRWRREFFDNTPELIEKLYQWNFCLSFGVIIVFLSFKKVHAVFQTAKDYFDGYEALGCFIGGQGSLVISDYLEILGKIEPSFWVFWILFLSSLLSGLICFWLYIVKKKLPQYNLTL